MNVIHLQDVKAIVYTTCMENIVLYDTFMTTGLGSPFGTVYENFKRFDFYFFILFGLLRRFQHCTGHMTTGSWKGRGNQYI